MRIYLLSFILSTMLWSVGCSTNKAPRYGINVYNRLDQPIRDVKITQNGKLKYRADVLGPHQSNPLVASDSGILGESVLEYIDPQGKQVREQLQPSDQLAISDFRGGMFLEINPGNDVQAFYRPREGNEVSSMPWNYQAGFERGTDFFGLGGGR